MITRGHYIGELIDEFAAIAAQVKMRNRLGLTDLTVYAENFFKEVLNILLGTSLSNLNAERSNEPGLDLGDEAAEIGVQVTSTATTAKVNSTLEKIACEQANSYKRIIVLVIGTKQSSYSLDVALSSKFKFTVKDIWDLDKLARLAINLGLEDLQRLHRLVRAEVARLKVELEVPDQEGKYPTSDYDNWEGKIKPKVGDGRAFREFLNSEYQIVLSKKDAEQLTVALSKLGRRLSNLPRVTREFLVMLLERREWGKSQRFADGAIHLLYPKVQRQYRGSDLDGELGILEHAGFLKIEGYDPHDYGPPEIGVQITNDSEDLAAEFLNFVKNRNLSLRNVIGEVDLSQF